MRGAVHRSMRAWRPLPALRLVRSVLRDPQRDAPSRWLASQEPPPDEQTHMEVNIENRLAAAGVGKKSKSPLMDAELIAPADGAVEVGAVLGHGAVVNGVGIAGSVLLLPQLCCLWDVRDAAELTAEHVALLLAVEPRPELFLVGCGEQPVQLPKEFVAALRAGGVAPESLTSANAASTFNVLSQEGRRVAAGLISPTPHARGGAGQAAASGAPP